MKKTTVVVIIAALEYCLVLTKNKAENKAKTDIVAEEKMQRCL
jgi:hypothetical protein